MIRQQMKRGRQLPGTTQGYYYSAKVSNVRPVTDYTVRLMLNLPDDSVPVETTQILWQQ
jgi:starch phosphorylase